MTRAPWREKVPFAGIQIIGARIAGKVDLENTKLIRPIKSLDSRIEGPIKLTHARTDRSISLDGSLLKEDFDAGSLDGESDLSLANGFQPRQDMILCYGK